jgi:hypothetical protein
MIRSRQTADDYCHNDYRKADQVAMAKKNATNTDLTVLKRVPAVDADIDARKSIKRNA